MDRAFVCEGRDGKPRRGTGDYAMKAMLDVYVAFCTDLKGTGCEFLA